MGNLAGAASRQPSWGSPIPPSVFKRTAESAATSLHLLSGTIPNLCCAVLCCAVLCCAVLCCAVLCCAVLCCAVLCRTFPFGQANFVGHMLRVVQCCTLACHAKLIKLSVSLAYRTRYYQQMDICLILACCGAEWRRRWNWSAIQSIC